MLVWVSPSRDFSWIFSWNNKMTHCTSQENHGHNSCLTSCHASCHTSCHLISILQLLPGIIVLLLVFAHPLIHFLEQSTTKQILRLRSWYNITLHHQIISQSYLTSHMTSHRSSHDMHDIIKQLYRTQKHFVCSAKTDTTTPGNLGRAVGTRASSAGVGF